MQNLLIWLKIVFLLISVPKTGSYKNHNNFRSQYYRELGQINQEDLSHYENPSLLHLSKNMLPAVYNNYYTTHGRRRYLNKNNLLEFVKFRSKLKWKPPYNKYLKARGLSLEEQGYKEVYNRTGREKSDDGLTIISKFTVPPQAYGQTNRKTHVKTIINTVVESQIEPWNVTIRKSENNGNINETIENSSKTTTKSQNASTGSMPSNNLNPSEVYSTPAKIDTSTLAITVSSNTSETTSADSNSSSTSSSVLQISQISTSSSLSSTKTQVSCNFTEVANATISSVRESSSISTSSSNTSGGTPTLSSFQGSSYISTSQTNTLGTPGKDRSEGLQSSTSTSILQSDNNILSSTVSEVQTFSSSSKEVTSEKVVNESTTVSLGIANTSPLEIEAEITFTSDERHEEPYKLARDNTIDSIAEKELEQLSDIFSNIYLFPLGAKKKEMKEGQDSYKKYIIKDYLRENAPVKEYSGGYVEENNEFIQQPVIADLLDMSEK